jgi:hypothetical protein
LASLRPAVTSPQVMNSCHVHHHERVIMHFRPTRRLAAIGASLPLLLGATLATGTTGASAQTAAPQALGNCSYPYVCVYNANQFKVGQYRDVTSSWQNFSRSDVTYAYNTRNDDVVYFRYSSNNTSCLAPGAQGDLRFSGYGYITGIRIDTSPVCYP